MEGRKLVDYFVTFFPGILKLMIKQVYQENIQQSIKRAIQSSINLIESAIEDNFGFLAGTILFGTTITIGCISNGNIYLVMFLIHSCYLFTFKSTHAFL